jgi:hypothetical protein
MNTAITGQYECVHGSGIGLDYFTSRIDRLTLFNNGRFTQITQERSRLSNMAQSLLSGQQASAGVTSAPETRREGTYTVQQNTITLYFDDGAQAQGQLSITDNSLQFSGNTFTKVSDSTMLPPTSRVKKDMDDIAKGLKIASTLGGMAMKAGKALHETLQTDQPAGQGQPQTPPQNPPPYRSAPPPPQAAPPQPPPAYNTYAPPAPRATPAQPEPIYCDQCGTLARHGKKFCGKCGAPLPLD